MWECQPYAIAQKPCVFLHVIPPIGNENFPPTEEPNDVKSSRQFPLIASKMQALTVGCQADWAARPLARSQPARPFNLAPNRRWSTSLGNTSRNVKTCFVPTPGPDTVAPIEVMLSSLMGM